MIEPRERSGVAALGGGQLARAAPRVAVRRERAAGRVPATRLVLTAIAAAIALAWAIPLLWVLSSSFKTQFEIIGADARWLPVALITFRSAYQAVDYGTVLASVVVAVAPPLLFFLFAQRFVIAGISRTGLKG
jgi:multiple sugar transport system permease protein